MTVREFRTEFWLPRPPEEVFAFFAEAHNLDRITPPWLHFRVLTPAPIEMRPGAIIDYRLRLRGFPIRWRTEIAAWDPPTRFVDRQVRGPYRLWVHEHTFRPGGGGTHVRDHVRYAVPGGWLEPLIHARIVRPDIANIFAYRERQIRAAFTPDPDAATP